MGYVVYVTRRDALNDQSAVPIPVEAWHELVSQDPELVPSADSPEHISWIGLSSVREPWFEWDDGEIWTQNPDSAQLSKMCEMARELNAFVLNEEGLQINEDEDTEEQSRFLYDYDFEAARKAAEKSSYPGIRGYMLLHSPVVLAVSGLSFVIVASMVRDLSWLDYFIAFLAISTLVLYAFYRWQERELYRFSDWLLTNLSEVCTGEAQYRGTPVTLDTKVSKFDAAYSFIVSHGDSSRWYFEGVDLRRGKWLHSLVSVLFGSWGLPWGPLQPIFCVILNLKQPPGDMLTVRNLYLRLDDELCQVVGKPDPAL